MTQGFVPYRRDVTYRQDARAVCLADVQGDLEFTRATNWGFALRRGLVALSRNDFAIIAHAMGCAAKNAA